MQEPDSFSQRLIRGFEFSDPGSQLLIVGLTLTMVPSQTPTFIRRGHGTTLPWNQSTIEVPIENCVTPPAKRAKTDTLRLEPCSF